MVVAVIALSRIASTTQQNQVLSVLLKPVTAEFGWTRSTFIGASAIGTILGGLAAVLVGPLIDRFGPRWVMFVGFFAMGGLMIAMGSIHSLWQFYAILISTRLILQGALNLGNNVVIAKWFINSRGRASALAAMGQRIGAGAMPLVTERLVGGFGLALRHRLPRPHHVGADSGADRRVPAAASGRRGPCAGRRLALAAHRRAAGGDCAGALLHAAADAADAHLLHPAGGREPQHFHQRGHQLQYVIRC